MKKLLDGYMTKYCAQPKPVLDLQWSPNPNLLPDIQDHLMGPPCPIHDNDQITHNMFNPAAKPPSSQVGTVESQPRSRSILNSNPHI